MKRIPTTMTCLLLTACCAIGTAQERERSPRSNDSSAKNIQEYFAGKLILMNHSTILMSDMAAQNTASEDVRQFANKLHQAHAAMNRKLAEIAPDVGAITTLDSAGNPHSTAYRGTPPVERENEVHKADTKRHADGRRSEQSFDSPLHHILSIERKAAENYLQSSTEMLSNYKGQDFDMGFLGFQIGQHTWALAELKAMNSVGDEEFQKLVTQAARDMKMHLRKARQLAKQFEDDAAQQK